MPDTSFSRPLSPQASEAVAHLAQLVLGQRSLDEVLDVVVDIAKDSLPGGPEVSITLVDDGAATVSSSSLLAVELDERQYDVGYGPCLDAARLGETVTVDDTAGETRWPEYIPHARKAGIVASVSVPLPFEDRHVGAMNVYFGQPGLLDEEAAQTARTVAAFVAVALTNADRYEKSDALAKQLGDALQSRAVIDQAKGILMAEYHFSPDDAFDKLVKLSQTTNRKLREVARALVEDTQRRR